jgi:hypothetical protein
MRIWITSKNFIANLHISLTLLVILYVRKIHSKLQNAWVFSVRTAVQNRKLTRIFHTLGDMKGEIKKFETSVPLTNQNCIHGEIQSRFREFLLPFNPKSLSYHLLCVNTKVKYTIILLIALYGVKIYLLY